MKKLLFLGVLAGVFALQNIASAAPTPEGCFDFNTNTQTIEYYYGSGFIDSNGTTNVCPKDIEIPGTLSGIAVKKIGGSNGLSFANKGITSMIIPTTVTEISAGAFAGNEIKTLNLPESLTIIGEGAFANNKINSVSIPNGVSSIGTGAFFGNLLTSVSLPNTVTYIGVVAFGRNLLTSVNIPTEVTNTTKLAFDNGIFYQDTGTGMMVLYLGNISSNNYVIPNTINGKIVNSMSSPFRYQGLSGAISILAPIPEIPEMAFFGNTISSLTIGDGVKKIGAAAFNNTRITNVTFGNSLEEVGTGAFAGNQLTGVILPSTIKYIRAWAFVNNPDAVNPQPVKACILGGATPMIDPSANLIVDNSICPPPSSTGSTNSGTTDTGSTSTGSTSTGSTTNTGTGVISSGTTNTGSTSSGTTSTSNSGTTTTPPATTTIVGGGGGGSSSVITSMPASTTPSVVPQVATPPSVTSMTLGQNSTPTIVLFSNFTPSSSQSVTSLTDSRLAPLQNQFGATTATTRNAPLTRGEFLRIVIEASGKSVASVDTSKLSYTDVSKNSPLARYIAYATENKIVSGYSNGTFNPNGKITRAEATKILVQATGVKLATAQTQFRDIAKDNTLANYIQTAYNNFLVGGTSKNTFEPNKTISKGELLKVIYNIQSATK